MLKWGNEHQSDERYVYIEMIYGVFSGREWLNGARELVQERALRDVRFEVGTLAAHAPTEDY